MMENIYQENIIDHYRNPHNKGNLHGPTVSAKDTNPLCGDAITMDLKIEGDRIADVKFMGTGCAISQAAISMLTDELKGMPLSEADKIDKDYIIRLLGIPISLGRLPCALLSLKVLRLALFSYKAQKA